MSDWFEAEWDRRTQALEARDLGAIARDQHPGRPLAELVPWLFAASDAIVVNKDAGVMAAFEFDGVDTDGASDTLLDALAAAVNKLMVYHQDQPLSAWWSVRRIRTTAYPESEFPDPISQRIDAAQHAAFLVGQNFINRHYLSFTLQPTTGAMKMQDRFAQALRRGESMWATVRTTARTLFDDQSVFAYTPAELQEACERLERLMADVTGMLSDIRFRRLSGPALGAFLHAMISPQCGDQDGVALSAEAWRPDSLLDEAIPEGSVMPARDFLHFSAGPKRRRYAVAVTVGGLPDPIFLGCLDRLCAIPGELTISYTLRNCSKSESESQAERMRNFHEGKKFSWKTLVKVSAGADVSNAPVNPGRENLSQQATYFLGQFTQGNIAGAWFYPVVICYGETLEQADDTADRVQEVLRSEHFRPDREELHMVSAFATTVPGGYKECARWKFFTSDAFSMIAPVHTVSRGTPYNHYIAEQTQKPAPALAVLPTEYATPFYFSPHVGDLGHGFIAGPSRAGKSIFANFFWSQFRRYPDAQVILFDKDLSSRVPILLQGGNYLDFGADTSALRFNPMASLTPETLEQRMAWIELLLSQRGDFRLDAEESKDLEASLRATITLEPHLKRLSTVFSHLRKPRLREAFEPWVGSRALARYFDNERDAFVLDDSARLIGLEVGKLLTHPQVAVPMMAYCFERIDALLVAQRAEGIVRPTFIYLAEVWHLLQNPQFAHKLNDWLKTLAKRCAIVWMDTQSAEDIATSGIFSALRDNIPNRIFLPNRNALSESLYKVYRSEFELSHNQVERIAYGTQKRDYFIQQGGLSRMVQYRPTPEVLACLRSDMQAQIVFDTHYESGAGGPGWQERYIQELIQR